MASKPAPAVDVNGFYVTKATAKKYKLKTLTDLAKGSSKLTFGGPPECQERPLCLGTTLTAALRLRVQERVEARYRRPADGAGAEDGDIDVALLFTASSVIPKDAVMLTDDKGLQPADNPVFLMRKDKATVAALKIVNTVSAKLTVAAYNKMSTAITEDKEDPADAAAEFLKSSKLT